MHLLASKNKPDPEGAPATRECHKGRASGSAPEGGAHLCCIERGAAVEARARLLHGINGSVAPAA